MEEGRKDILRVAGFSEELQAVDEGRCPICKDKVNTLDFRDDLSRREFGISGLDQKCQDQVFGRG